MSREKVNWSVERHEELPALFQISFDLSLEVLKIWNNFPQLSNYETA